MDACSILRPYFLFGIKEWKLESRNVLAVQVSVHNFRSTCTPQCICMVNRLINQSRMLHWHFHGFLRKISRIWCKQKYLRFRGLYYKKSYFIWAFFRGLSKSKPQPLVLNHTASSKNCSAFRICCLKKKSKYKPHQHTAWQELIRSSGDTSNSSLAVKDCTSTISRGSFALLSCHGCAKSGLIPVRLE